MRLPPCLFAHLFSCGSAFLGASGTLLAGTDAVGLIPPLGNPRDSGQGPKSGLWSAKDVLEPEPAPGLWSFGIGYAHRFRLQANFRNLGGRVPGLPLPPPGNAIFGDYDDGFVRPDVSGLQDTTTFWQYQNDSQYDPTGSGTLNLSIRDVPGTASVRERDDAGGVDFFVRRDMGEFSSRGREFRWGWQARLNYTRVDVANRGALSLDAREATDRFPLNGVIPPLAGDTGYTGSFAGPGPLLDTGASRSVGSAPGGARVTGSRQLDADLFALSLGPWLELSPTPQLSLQLEGGLNLAFIDGRFSQRSVTTSGSLMSTSQSEGSDSELMPGFYLGGGASYRLSDQLAIYFNARYEYLDDFSVGAGASRAELSFDDSFMVSTGLVFSF